MQNLTEKVVESSYQDPFEEPYTPRAHNSINSEIEEPMSNQLANIINQLILNSFILITKKKNTTNLKNEFMKNLDIQVLVLQEIKLLKNPNMPTCSFSSKNLKELEPVY